MANNRMYLLHRPTNQWVYLGKRMGGQWYDVQGDLPEKLTELFESTNGDDFALVMEDTTHCENAVESMGFDEKGDDSEMSEWQPIETAPKDADILGWNGKSMTTVRWVWFPGYWALSEAGGYTEDDEWEPAHWMPLPEPPNLGVKED